LDITLTTDFIRYSTTNYDRWAGFLSGVQAIIAPSLAVIFATTAVNEIRLEYWDRFDRSVDCDKNEPLINSGSKLIGEAFRDAVGAWHAHVGFFSNVQHANRRTLINANVDVVTSMPNNLQQFPSGVTGQSRIYTLGSLQAINSCNPFDDWGVIEPEIVNVHHLLKSVLGDIIHPSIATSVQLNANPLAIEP
jgi:uncharacterized protein (TIGR04255 family)